jgi:retron-type reverse transcriptase
MDKIIYNAINIVLTLIYERYQGLDYLAEKNCFHNSSYGARFTRGCHSLLHVLTSGDLGSWCISVNIFRCFDFIDQKRLLNIIERSIKDSLLSETLQKMFKSEKQRKGLSKCNKSFGILQGTPLSFFFCNLYLNEFDIFMKDFQETFFKKSK